MFRSASWPNSRSIFFFFNDTATTEIYTLSLHDALPISNPGREPAVIVGSVFPGLAPGVSFAATISVASKSIAVPRCRITVHRSEEHTSELQSRPHLVCRLLLEKKTSTRLAGGPRPELKQ